jgi:hypothetical protein
MLRTVLIEDNDGADHTYGADQGGRYIYHLGADASYRRRIKLKDRLTLPIRVLNRNTKP